jgi:hypothetical protein
LFLVKIEALKREEDVGKEVEERKVFFFSWDDEEFCFLFCLLVSVLRLSEPMIPPFELTSVWTIGAFPPDTAVS